MVILTKNSYVTFMWILDERPTAAEMKNFPAALIFSLLVSMN